MVAIKGQRSALPACRDMFLPKIGQDRDARPDGQMVAVADLEGRVRPLGEAVQNAGRVENRLAVGSEQVDLRGSGPIIVRDEEGTHTVVAADGTSPECGFRTEDAVGIAAVVAGAAALGTAAIGMRRGRTAGTERSSEDSR